MRVHPSARFMLCHTGNIEGCGISCYRYGGRKLGAAGTNFVEAGRAVLRYP